MWQKIAIAMLCTVTVTKCPWIQDLSYLTNNRAGVGDTFLWTEKWLKREPEWQAAYWAQIQEMVKRGAMTNSPRRWWNGNCIPFQWEWGCVTHQPLGGTKSSLSDNVSVHHTELQSKGLNMNDLLIKVPDVLNPIRAVLLMLRKGEYAALIDIWKMYCITPSGLKTRKYTFTDYYGEIPWMRTLLSMQSQESTLVNALQVA